jgi:hypothetical protein
MNSHELDAILNQALDDFEEQSLVAKAAKEATAAKEKEAKFQAELAEKEKYEAQLQMEAFLNSLQDPSYGDTLQTTLKSLSSTNEGINTVDGLFDQLANQFNTNLNSNLYPENASDPMGIELGDREVAATMSMIGQAQKGMEGFEPAKLEEVGENMMDDMISQFEAMGEKEDYNEVS